MEPGTTQKREPYEVLCNLIGMVGYDSSAPGVLLEPVASSAQALLEVWESIALHRDLRALVHDLKERLPRLVNFTSLWLVLHEPARNKMRLHIIATPQRMDVDVIERNVDDSPSGLVWQTQQPLIVADTMKETRFPEAVELLRREGVRSFCILSPHHCSPPFGRDGLRKPACGRLPGGRHGIPPVCGGASRGGRRQRLEPPGCPGPSASARARTRSVAAAGPRVPSPRLEPAHGGSKGLLGSCLAPLTGLWKSRPH